jgi:hypothetical protein
MAFKLNDLYTTSGAGVLYHCWTDEVEKFDTSSHYSWEQDNLPIYDLEERTELLHTKMGYPAVENIQPQILVVSADAPSEDLQCSANLFETVQDAVDAIPRHLRYPVIIEVASFGDLGTLDIDNISFEGSGSLEIVNRNFTKRYPYLESSVGPGAGIAALVANNANGADGLYREYFLNGFTSGPDSPSSLQVLGLGDGTGQRIFSGAGIIDARQTNNTNGIFISPGYFPGASSTEYHRLNASLGAPFSGAVAGNYLYPPYEDDPHANDPLTTYDVSVVNSVTDTVVNRKFNVQELPYVAGSIYNNHFSRVSISNCKGPLYFRNFLVNGGGGPTATEFGLTILNSNIVVEDCAVVLCRKAGFNIENSQVKFFRGVVAHRCYDYSGTSRVDGPYSDNKNNREWLPSESAGLRASNSHITFSATHERESEIQTSAVWNFNQVVHFSRNTIGMKLDNCVIDGGIQRNVFSGNAGNEQYNLHIMGIEGNTCYGVLAKNSVWDYRGRMEVYHNTRGANFKNCTINHNEFQVDHNQIYGLKYDHTNVTYNRDYTDFLPGLISFVNPEDFTRYKYQYDMQLNGQHMVLDNSKFTPTVFSSVPDTFEKVSLKSSFGVRDSAQLPAIELMNGSEAEFIHLQYTNDNGNYLTSPDQSIPGVVVAAKDSSEVYFRGTSAICTAMIGPTTYALQTSKAAVYAENGSKAHFMGPTVIAKFAVDAMAQRNSGLAFTPHQTRDGKLDVSAYDLESPANHTHVELHSTRSCLVADSNSYIDMKDLGDYHYNWTGTNGQLLLASGVNYDTGDSGLNTSAFTYTGGIQFYPNSNDAEDYTTGIAKANPTVPDLDTTDNFLSDTTNGKQNYYFINNDIYSPGTANDVSAVTSGGLCVRALNGSHVSVKNVHFPTGWWNPSGIIHDTSGADTVDICNRLFIWNIANGSKLHASYTSVSGNYPQDVGYHGPNALFYSGTDAPNFGLPSGTPDTSTLSVLDSYGYGFSAAWPTESGLRPWGTQEGYENIGPFRIYTSVDAVAHWMKDSTLKILGGFAQYYAQGYQPSASTEFDSTVSSVYLSVVKENDAGELVTAGYYYHEDMTDCNPDDIMLDDSGSNTFANAKNGASALSGRKRICTINPTHIQQGSGMAPNDASNYGRGFKSPNVFDLSRIN